MTDHPGKHSCVVHCVAKIHFCKILKSTARSWRNRLSGLLLFATVAKSAEAWGRQLAASFYFALASKNRREEGF